MKSAAPPRALKIGIAIVGVAAAMWGLRATVVEGFILPWPRQPIGDFSAVMFDRTWWDGTGIVYGPLFMPLIWLNRWRPDLSTIYFFNLADAVLATAAFVACARASRLGLVGTIVALALWLDNRYLMYAFAVNAVPEFLECMLLSLAWLAATQAKRAREGALVMAAALVKTIPLIFLWVVSIRPSRRALTAAVIVSAVAIPVAGIGQHMSFGAVIRGLLVPSQSAEGLSVSLGDHATRFTLDT